MATHPPSDAASNVKQRFFLAMLAMVVAVIVFLCGVFVGRGVPARRVAGRLATEAAPDGAGTRFGGREIAPDPETARGSPLESLSYFNRLSSIDPVPETLAAAGSWTVQVTALPSGDEARRVADGLQARGYPAFVVPPAPGAAPAAVYRVHVGPYADRGEANRVRDRLETQGQFEPWLVRP